MSKPAQRPLQYINRPPPSSGYTYGTPTTNAITRPVQTTMPVSTLPPVDRTLGPVTGGIKQMPQLTPYGEGILGSMPSGIVPTYLSRNLDKDKKIEGDLKLPESELYTRLTEFESQVDFALKKSQLKLQAALPESPSRKNTLKRVLRFTISNTYEGQAQIHTEASQSSVLAVPASWSIRLSGRLLDDQGRLTSGTGTRKMSSFFKSIHVQLDKTEFPLQWNMAWTRQRTTEDVDTFTFSRKSNKESTAHIFLHLADSVPESFAIAQPLKTVLNLPLPHYTRTSVIVAIWNYIRAHGLQDAERRSTVICDESLRNIFEVDNFEYDDIPDLIHHHLSPPEPIQIAYQIRFASEPSESEVTYDIPVEIENPVNQFNLNCHHSELQDLNKKLLEDIEELSNKKRKREFYLEFATDPLNFMDDWLTSQIRDHKIICNPALHDPEFERSTEFFLQPLAEDAVHRYSYDLPNRMPQDLHFAQSPSE